jgi:SsrA-binding protein
VKEVKTHQTKIALAKKDQHKNTPPTIQNRKARHDYHIDDTYEAGIALKGTEVKSIRDGKASLSEAFAYLSDGEVWLKNMYVKPYKFGSYANHDERRDRKLLLKKRQIREIDKQINQKGFTLIPLKLYFKGGYAKVLMGLARGKKQYDKREDIKEKDVRRELDRKIKGNYSVNL